MNRMEDRNNGSQPDSDTSFQIFGIQSINPPHEEYLEMGTCFLEEQFDIYGNASKYVVLLAW